jgi:hypothetical protein
VTPKIQDSMPQGRGHKYNFFHRKAQWRAKKNRVKKLKTENGEWEENEENMRQIAADYFQSLYTKDPGVNPQEVLELVEARVSDEVNDELCKPFTNTEIADVLFQIGPLKAPGPDGFPARFFRRNWDVIKIDVIAAVKEFFNSGSMPEGVNVTSIVLIPKGNQPECLKDFRPISLCNVIYKVVAKYLVNRLRPAPDNIISPTQSAFVPGCLITDNVLIAFECIHSLQQLKREDRHFCAYKLDLTKAYDRADWEFLKNIMLKLSFHRKWVDWVMCCVTTVRFAVNFNGVLSDPFQPMRGLRQGDPLSPYLFLFVADSLSLLLRKQELEGLITPIRVTRNAPPISHLLFADDSLLFFKANREQAIKIKEVLKVFCKCTGQLINQAKCSIMFARNCPANLIKEVRQTLSIQRANFEAKYLGLPTPEGRMKAERF